MTLTYTLEFFDYWHLSSGLSAGAKLDSTVVKDENNLPYASGKTIKGLLREIAVQEFDCDFIDRCFGTTTNKSDKCYNKDKKLTSGECYFSNANLNKQTKNEIVSNKLQDNLYDVIASTKIGEKNKKNEVEGIAVDDSLREIEVVIPLELEGKIDIPTQNDFNSLKNALKKIKRMGLNRNRGLGRCEFLKIEKVEK